MEPAEEQSKPLVLVVEDEYLVSWAACRDLRQWGYTPVAAATLAEARAFLANQLPDVILLDIRLPDGRGLDLLAELPRPAGPAVIVISAVGEASTIVEATKLGATDFLTKPCEADDLHEALLRLNIVRAPATPSAATSEELAKYGILSRDPAMLGVVDSLQRFARTPRSTVLIFGETGTGKSLAARVLHQLSARAGGPFVEINCAAVPETLLESELMGHERGAYTDAKTTRKGLIESADSGTLFLDEIGDMPLAMQSKLLRFIETHSYRRLGSNIESVSDVRIVAATHMNLADLVAAGRFREDLFYRLKVLTVRLPPLRERPHDIDLLADHMLRASAADMASQVLGFAPLSRKLMRLHSWAGNVRELKYAIEAAVALCGDSRYVQPEHLPAELQQLADQVASQADSRELVALEPPTASARRDAEYGDVQQPRTSESGTGLEVVFRLDGSMALADLEKIALERAMEFCEGNQVRAAKLLGVSRDLLRYRLKKFGLIE